MYNITVARSAVKELESLESDIFDKVAHAIDGLQESPRPAGVKKLKGFDRYYRIRVGEYRIVYEIDDKNQSVLITRIRHRKDAYR